MLKEMWVHDLKLGGEGEIMSWKAQWVARCDMQWAGLDFDKTWSMVARMKSVCMLIASAACLGWPTCQWDFLAAYLNVSQISLIFPLSIISALILSVL